MFIGEPVSSPYGADFFESLGDSVGKKIPVITSTSANHPFFLIFNIPSVSLSVFTDGLFPSVFTDGLFSSVYADDLTNGLNSIGNGDLKLPTELFRRKFRWY
jgi:hypothetical protein